MTSITVRNLSKEFHKASEEKPLQVLDNLSFNVKDQEFITIFGPNGSGKTTLLNLIAGLDKPTKGEININGQLPGQSKVGFVFQNYNESMMPWRTAKENITFPLEIQHVSESERNKTAEYLLKKVGLFELKDKYFYELSGGQKQLVAICRAYAYNPELLIMDEPFSALDYSTTRKMEMELLDIWKESKKTTIFVSHDIDEAILLADKTIILSKRPAKVKGIIEINLPRPRTLDMLSSQAFFKLRNEILELFENEE